MSVRKWRRKMPNGKVVERWMVDVVFRHPDGSPERVRHIPRVQTRTGAERYERDLLRRLEGQGGRRDRPQGAPPPSVEATEVPTLRKFWQEFLATHVTVNNKPSEQQAKRGIAEHHLMPAFGDRRLDQIVARDIEAYKAIKLGGPRPYSAKSINNQLAVLRTVLRVAVAWEVLAKAPAIKDLRVSAVEVEFLDFEDAAKLIAVSSPPWRAMVGVALHTGLRIGELLALRWADLDLKAGRLVVRRSSWRGIVGSPKGGRSREIPLNKIVLRVLDDHRHSLGPLVFCQGTGRALTHAMCRKPLLQGCALAGVKRVQWHALRHTFASHLVMRGVPLRTVQLLLGHASFSTTERYAHLLPEMRKDAVAVLERLPCGNMARGEEHTQ